MLFNDSNDDNNNKSQWNFKHMSTYCQLKTVQIMMETTNIMSQFLLEDIINFLKTLVWYFVTVKMYDTPIYIYLCTQHCNETICGKNSMQVNICNCLKNCIIWLITSLTVCIQWERETPQQNHTILCSTGCVSILECIHQNTDYVDDHKILMWV